MAVVVFVRIPGDREMLEELSQRMGVEQNPPAGLIVHTGTEKDGQVEVVDVWESEEDFETFFRERIGPTIESLGPPASPGAGGAPSREIRPAFDLVLGRR